MGSRGGFKFPGDFISLGGIQVVVHQVLCGVLVLGTFFSDEFENVKFS
jgi:hypothetical protein